MRSPAVWGGTFEKSREKEQNNQTTRDNANGEIIQTLDRLKNTMAGMQATIINLQRQGIPAYTLLSDQE